MHFQGKLFFILTPEGDAQKGEYLTIGFTIILIFVLKIILTFCTRSENFLLFILYVFMRYAIFFYFFVYLLYLQYASTYIHIVK